MKNLYLIYKFLDEIKVVGFEDRKAYDEAYKITDACDKDSKYQYIASVNTNLQNAITNAIIAFNEVLNKCFYTPIRLQVQEYGTSKIGFEKVEEYGIARIGLEKNQFVDCFTIHADEAFEVFIKKFFGDLGYIIKFNNNHSIIFFTKRGD